MTSDRPEYRPGERASLAFAMTDEHGKPAPGRSAWPPSMRPSSACSTVVRVWSGRFFTLEQELLEPVYEIKEWSPDEAEAGDVAERTPGRAVPLRTGPVRRTARGPEAAARALTAALGNDPEISALDDPERAATPRLGAACRIRRVARRTGRASSARAPDRTAWSLSSYSEKLR